MRSPHGDADGNQTIELDEFVAFVRKREEVLSKLFSEIDSHGEADGHITSAELKSFLSKALQRPVSFEEAQALLEKLDTDKSGTVEYQELVRGTLLTSGDAMEVFRIWSTYDPEHFYLSRKTPVPTPPAVTVAAGLISGRFHAWNRAN